MNALTLAALGTGFTFLMTAAGAAVVFLFKNEIKPSFQRVFLGFAAGVMIAASVWSLLIPSIEMAGEQGVPGWLPAAGGFALGALFLMVLDALMPHLHPGSSEAEGVHTSFKRTTLLVLAVTLHNIPEGMAVGLACALAAGGGSSSVTLAGAMALCLGMGLQNFPEGAAISLPLRREGLSRPKSFVYGALSGIVEPIGGILAVLIAGSVTPLMPWFLSFAAGAMIYVVVEELIPEAHLGEHSHPGTLGVLAGFLVMMVLEVYIPPGTARGRGGHCPALQFQSLFFGASFGMPGSGRHVRSPRMAADEKGRVFHYGHRGCADRSGRWIHRLPGFGACLSFAVPVGCGASGERLGNGTVPGV